MGASTRQHSTLQNSPQHKLEHVSTLQHSSHHTRTTTHCSSRHACHSADIMSAAMTLPGETARLHALTLMRSAHTSTAWHHSAGTRHTHTHMRPVLNAPLVKSSPNLLPMGLPNLSPLRCVGAMSLESGPCRTRLLRPCKQYASAMRCSATGQYVPDRYSLRWLLPRICSR